MSTTTFAPPPGDSTIIGRDTPPADRAVIVLPLLPEVPARAAKPVCHFPQNCKWPTCAC